MLGRFAVRADMLEQLSDDESGLNVTPVWIDVVQPSEDDRQTVLEDYGQHLPSLEEVVEIEATSRFFCDEHGLHIHSYFIDDPLLAFNHDATMPRNVSASLILNDGKLYSIREEELAVFRLFRMRARRAGSAGATGTRVLLGLFETKVDLIADLLERIYRELDDASKTVFSGNGHEMHFVLSTITRFEDLNGKLRLVLLDTQRAMRFLLRYGKLGDEDQQKAREILRDVDSLTPHTNYLFEKVSFLMDAATGIINVEQNSIIKIMTLASVIFLPPTLIASLYGMNFASMPELGWTFGYPMAIGIMVLSAIAPLFWFKRKGWL
ncbi:MAG: magnesium/cobalt transporter CorA [Gammaproteobacteria bacterium]|nr:magnesium/cobalt transporter CorA [Gammaproteobacteria bacterium]